MTRIKQKPPEAIRGPVSINSDGTFMDPDYFRDGAPPMPEGLRSLVLAYRAELPTTHEIRAKLEWGIQEELHTSGYYKLLKQAVSGEKARTFKANAGPYFCYLMAGGRPNDFCERRRLHQYLTLTRADAEVVARFWKLFEPPYSYGLNAVRERVIDQCGDIHNGNDDKRHELFLRLLDEVEAKGTKALPARRSKDRKKSTSDHGGPEDTTLSIRPNEFSVTPSLEMASYEAAARQILSQVHSGESLEVHVRQAVAVFQGLCEVELKVLRDTVRNNRPKALKDFKRQELNDAQAFFGVAPTKLSEETDGKWKSTFRKQMMMHGPDMPNRNQDVFAKAVRFSEVITTHTRAVRSMKET